MSKANKIIEVNAIDHMWSQKNMNLIQLVEKHCTGPQLSKIADEYYTCYSTGLTPIKTPTCICGRHPLSSAYFVDDPFHKGIFLASIQRTGSTLVNRLLNRITALEIPKTHRLYADHCPLIRSFPIIYFTVRDPYDAAYSQGRYLDQKMTKELIDDMFQDVPILYSHSLLQSDPILSKMLPNPPNVVNFIRYEDFWNKTEELTNHLYDNLSRQIPQMISVLSSDQLKQIAHDNSPELTTIPDNMPGVPHVGPRRGLPGMGHELLPQELKDYIAEKYGHYFEALWGYKL